MIFCHRTKEHRIYQLHLSNSNNVEKAGFHHIEEKKIMSNITDIYAGVYHVSKILDRTL
jgi:hypothetical protein